MKKSSYKTERLHSLDALRAIMMMLGVILHSAITYIGGKPSPGGWPLRDPNSANEFLKWLFSIIHNFRMPIFMLVAGFFGSLLFYEYSSKRMISNRIKRIVIPFVFFIILLWPLVNLSFCFSSKAFSLDQSLNSTICEIYMDSKFSDFTGLVNFLPKQTMHLWFLYYLIIFSFASCYLGRICKKLPVLSKKISDSFVFVINRPLLKVILFSLLTFLLLTVNGISWVKTSRSFIPELGTSSFYFSFYLFGWILFKLKFLLSSFLTHDKLFLTLGILLYTCYFLMDLTKYPFPIVALIKSICVWLFIFGFMGLFIRWFSQYSAFMRYISDSAYWVYLFHLPLTGLIPGLIKALDISAILKFSIVVLLTLLVCFVTYHYFVRSTFIGKFLNGRKYSRRLSDTKV